MKVLIAEDDMHIRQGLKEILEVEGYEVIEAANGRDALSMFSRHKPDFVCLDIMMPGKSGYDVCREIRSTDLDVPVVFISAKSEEIDKVVGLELGADDYIMKPFGVKEVVARIRAITRRCLSRGTKGGESRTSLADLPDSQTFQMDDLTIIPKELRARRTGVVIDLALREVKILYLLFSRSGEVVDRDTLFNECWGMDYLPNSRTLEQTISNLRRKIELNPKEPRIIHTVHNAGYRYENNG